jgi:hypothetical protein
VFGTVTSDSASDLQFSAANGYARMHLSTVRGKIRALPDAGSWLALELSSINNRSIDLYNFSGTGSASANDADPDFYEIDTGTLPLDGLGVADAVAVAGFPAAFGGAPADFTAQTAATR